MRYYRALCLFFVLFSLFYASLGSITWEMDRFEIFPFFSWSLFSDVPEQVGDYGLKIVRVGNDELENPLYFEYTDQWFEDAQSIEAWSKIQALGRAIWDEDRAEIAVRREQFEEFHLKNRSDVAYTVHLRYYRPLERWHTGKFISERLIGEFVSGVK